MHAFCTRARRIVCVRHSMGVAFHYARHWERAYNQIPCSQHNYATRVNIDNEGMHSMVVDI